MSLSDGGPRHLQGSCGQSQKFSAAKSSAGGIAAPRDCRCLREEKLRIRRKVRLRCPPRAGEVTVVPDMCDPGSLESTVKNRSKGNRR